MSNYIPHHTKKKLKLARKEQKLKRLLTNSATPDKLLRCAQSVLEARVRALKAQLAQLAPSGAFDSQRRAIDEKIECLLKTSIVEILIEFGHDPHPACLDADS